MPELELLYFPFHARALLIRMLLKKGNVTFKDTHPNFGEIKASTYS